MAIVQTQTTSFKVDILNGVHNFSTGVVRAATTADTFKIVIQLEVTPLQFHKFLHLQILRRF